MKTQDAIDHFGSATALANAVGATIGAVSQWGDFPPGGRQMQIQHLTRGKLKAEPDCMNRKKADDKARA
jgi:transcriptional repressor of cell division inhibition gene dicB